MAGFTTSHGGQLVEFTLDENFISIIERAREMGGKGKDFLKEFGKANRKIGTGAARFVRRTVKGVAGARIAKDIRSRLAKKGPRGERLEIPGFQVGVFPKRPSSAFALVQERGTKTFNPEAPRDILPSGRGVKALAVKTDDKTGGRRHPGQEAGRLVMVLWGKEVRTPQGLVIGGLYKPDELKHARRSGLGGLRSIRAVYLLFLGVALKPKFYLRNAMELYQGEIEKGYTDFFAGWFERTPATS